MPYPSPKDLSAEWSPAVAVAACACLDELAGYEKQARLRGLLPGEIAEILARRQELQRAVRR